jgi:hypothetical protein
MDVRTPFHDAASSAASPPRWATWASSRLASGQKARPASPTDFAAQQAVTDYDRMVKLGNNENPWGPVAEDARGDERRLKYFEPLRLSGRWHHEDHRRLARR